MYGKVTGVNVADSKKNGRGIKNKWKIGIHRENLGNYATFSFARKRMRLNGYRHVVCL